MRELEIESLDQYGRGVSHVGDLTYSVFGALPGEKIRIEIMNKKKDIIVCNTVKVIKESKNRIEPACPYFYICGGCDIMHMSYDYQVKFKENKVKDIIKKFTSIDSTIIKDIIRAEKDLNYRNKITLHVKKTFGLYRKQSYEIVDIDKCMIVNNMINDVISDIKKLPLLGIEKIVIRCDEKQNDTMLIVEANDEFLDMIWKNKLEGKINSLICINKGREKVIFGNGVLLSTLDNKIFEVSATSFFQVNNRQCEILYSKVIELANLNRNDIVLDLYCGVGSIGLMLADKVKYVYGVEINSKAISMALKNKVKNNIDNASFYASDIKDILNKLPINPDVIVVDPPRAGLDIKTINKIKQWNVDRFIYVSCDPFTMARDLEVLSEIYNVESITPVDLFPNTNHIENVCKLSRKENGK